jgi:hypothetical protein
MGLEVRFLAVLVRWACATHAPTIVFEMQGTESVLARKAHAASSAAAAVKKDVRASGLPGASVDRARASYLVPLCCMASHANSCLLLASVRRGGILFNRVHR